MSQDENKRPDMDGPEDDENKPCDLPVIDLTDYQVVKPERFLRHGKKKDKASV